MHTLLTMPRTLAAEAAEGAGEASGAGFDVSAANALTQVTNFGIVLICAGIIVCVWRILKGPTLVDRGIAGDTLAIHVVAFVILATIRFESLVMFDAVLIVSILGFVSTVATAQYIARRGNAA